MRALFIHLVPLPPGRDRERRSERAGGGPCRAFRRFVTISKGDVTLTRFRHHQWAAVTVYYRRRTGTELTCTLKPCAAAWIQAVHLARQIAGVRRARTLPVNSVRDSGIERGLNSFAERFAYHAPAVDAAGYVIAWEGFHTLRDTRAYCETHTRQRTAQIALAVGHKCPTARPWVTPPVPVPARR